MLKELNVSLTRILLREWSTNESDDPASVYSRTGYIIKYKNCPILWASKLQSEISLATKEA